MAAIFWIGEAYGNFVFFTRGGFFSFWMLAAVSPLIILNDSKVITSKK
jgi:hypothetical protein